MKKMKKIAALLLAVTMVLVIASCGHKNEQEDIHKIGVIVYDLKELAGAWDFDSAVQRRK